jgi:hypothetical protein
MVSRFSQNMTRAMTEDQFCQVVDAILNGKYSWACLLILQFSGYNPLHYIPYRTYNRLMKDNSRPRKDMRQQGESKEQNLTLGNLPHLHTVEEASQQVRGGYGFRPLYGSYKPLASWN